MPTVPLQLAGPSYQLANRRFDAQRTVNMFPTVSESGSSKAPAMLQSIPGLTLFAALSNPIRGSVLADGRLFVVSGPTLYELSSAGVATSRGTLGTSSGVVDMTHGTTQLVIVDGANGYVLNLGSNVFATIGSNFRGSDRVAFIDGYFVFVDPGTQQFYWSEINDATIIDALDFASAEGSPDDLVAHLADHRELWLFGERTVEVWVNTGSEAVFERNSGAFMEVGCIAVHSAQKIDNSVIWLGQDKDGGGIVYRAVGYNPQRVSTLAVEEALQASTDLASAMAFTYQQNGHSFYCIQAPGLSTTWCLDVATGAWHERAELVSGEYEQHRANNHVFAFNKHLVGADDGNVYWFNASAYTNNGAVLVRERITPHQSTPSYARMMFGTLEVDCRVGEGITGTGAAPTVMLRHSNDGGVQFSGWRTASLGALGQRNTRVRFHRCGSGYDRVWQIRCTDDAPFALIGAAVAVMAGA